MVWYAIHEDEIKAVREMLASNPETVNQQNQLSRIIIKYDITSNSIKHFIV
jgi:hypothetical protein